MFPKIKILFISLSLLACSTPPTPLEYTDYKPISPPICLSPEIGKVLRVRFSGVNPNNSQTFDWDFSTNDRSGILVGRRNADFASKRTIELSWIISRGLIDALAMTSIQREVTRPPTLLTFSLEGVDSLTGEPQSVSYLISEYQTGRIIWKTFIPWGPKQFPATRVAEPEKWSNAAIEQAQWRASISAFVERIPGCRQSPSPLSTN